MKGAIEKRLKTAVMTADQQILNAQNSLIEAAYHLKSEPKW
jgi:hypothetical protein